MPTNLNALIRYRTIDSCLKNKYIDCTIDYFINACSEALGEYRGIYKLVSERTIRDDIRVMRSDILGFNAPIECNDGVYSYSNPNYTIFDIPLERREVLLKARDFLLLNKKHIPNPEVNEIIEELTDLVETLSYSFGTEIQFSMEPVDEGYENTPDAEEKLKWRDVLRVIGEKKK